MKKLKILIIQDQKEDANLVTQNIQNNGYILFFKTVSKMESLEIDTDLQNWDIIITNQSLPKFDYKEIISIIRQKNRDIPIIIVANSVGEYEAIQAIRAGANDYITKNNLIRLPSAIERELREAKSRKAHRKAEETIYFMAHHDALTGLYNRFELEKRLYKAIESANEKNLVHFLLYLDLDQFKIINDTCGHMAGDELLKQLSVLLSEKIGEKNLIARIGGDEFAILLENYRYIEAKTLGIQILNLIDNFRFNWLGQIFSISGSIGAIEISSKHENFQKILSLADLACYAAKDSGRNRIRFYQENDREMKERRREMQTLNILKEGLENNQLVLYKQLITSLPFQEKKFKYFEFLLRLQGENEKLLLPGFFMPAAERYNMMPLVDRWVIDNAFEYIAIQHGKQNSLNSKYFLNLSGESLSDDLFFDYISEKLAFWRIKPELVCFEITETVAISDLKKTLEFIKEIRKKGCSFALDDFGSGMSSFNYLKNLSVDYLKIDGSFVKDICKDKVDFAIVEAINKIGHIIGLKTIAEYVEDNETMQVLEKLGLDFAQGFGIDLPKPIVEC